MMKIWRVDIHLYKMKKSNKENPRSVQYDPTQ